MAPKCRPGDRIRLISTTDPHTRLPAGALGTARFIDACGTIQVAWDDGHMLGLIPGVDLFDVLPARTPPVRDDRRAEPAARGGAVETDRPRRVEGEPADGLG